MTEPLTIDVVSDVVCPWCYLGKRRLERALAELPKVEVAVRWRPFRLDPTIPPEGIDRHDYLTRKFGSVDAVAESHANLAVQGADEGIDYHFERIARSPDTTDAHRLIRWAAPSGHEDATVEALFRAYFRDGKDIGDHQVLAELAAAAGLDATAIAERLATDEDRDAVKAEIDEAFRIGVSGVPCFILGGRYAVMGAQPADALAEAIRTVVEERAATTTATA